MTRQRATLPGTSGRHDAPGERAADERRHGRSVREGRPRAAAVVVRLVLTGCQSVRATRSRISPVLPPGATVPPVKVTSRYASGAVGTAERQARDPGGEVAASRRRPVAPDGVAAAVAGEVIPHGDGVRRERRGAAVDDLQAWPDLLVVGRDAVVRYCTRRPGWGSPRASVWSRRADSVPAGRCRPRRTPARRSCSRCRPRGHRPHRSTR